MEVASDYNKDIATMRLKEFPALAGNLKYNSNLIYIHGLIFILHTTIQGHSLYNLTKQIYSVGILQYRREL